MWTNIPVDNMHDTISDKHISHRDHCLVHHDPSIHQRDLHRSTVQRGDRLAVLQRRTVSYGAIHHVVFEDTGKLGGGQFRNCRINRRKCLVCRREDGDVRERVDCVKKVGLHQGAGKGRETGRLCDGGHVRRNGENGIDNVDDAAIEFDILYQSK